MSYVLHADAPARALIELVRSSDETVIANWDGGQVAPETPQSLTWDGTVAGRVQPQGRYSFRVSAVSADGLRAVSAHAPLNARDPAEIQFLRHEFPIRGPHYYGESAARFGGGRGHQGHDTFAACGTPVVAARGGVVKFKQYHGAAGNYIVIDGVRTGTDYAYMHLRDAALVNEGSGYGPASRSATSARPAAPAAATSTSRCGARRAGTTAAGRSTRCRRC